MSTIVTGAGGYVGSLLCSGLRRRGLNVIGLARSGAAGNDMRPFVLGETARPEMFVGAETLIHCAWDFRAFGRTSIWRVNVEGSVKLFEAARIAGVRRIVFISSMSAFEGCRSQYGQSKLAVEQTAQRFGLLVVRPGMVWGENARGMMGSLRKMAAIPLLTPLPGRGLQPAYLAHEEDLAELIWGILMGSAAPVGRPILAACEQPETMRRVLEVIASQRRKVFLPIPPRLIWAGLRALELAGLRPRMRSDGILSLLNPDPDPDFSVTRRLGGRFRPFSR